MDLSSSGVYVEYAAAAEPGRVLEMLFELPFEKDFQQVYVGAEVVRSVVIGARNAYGIAFRFVSFARASDKVLSAYLALRESRLMF